METNFGTIIKQKRKKAKITQIDFALRTGIGLSTIRDIEQGKDTIKLSTLKHVLNALGMTIKIEDKQ